MKELSVEQRDLLFQELIQHQQAVVFRTAMRICPSITEEDLLQPNDFPMLENHPNFRYEEGVLAGLMTAQMAFRAAQSGNFAE